MPQIEPCWQETPPKNRTKGKRLNYATPQLRKDSVDPVEVCRYMGLWAARSVVRRHE